MATKRLQMLRSRMGEAGTKMAQREEESAVDERAADVGLLGRADVPAAALTAQSVRDNVYAQLESYKRATADARSQIEELQAKLAGTAQADVAFHIDPDLVDVPGFNRLPSSFVATDDPDFSIFCDNIRLFGGNKQPAMVRPSRTSPGRYDLVFGERRLRACAITDTPFLVISADVDDDELYLLRELENVGRKDKTLLERAFSLQRYVESPPPYGSLQDLLKGLKISESTFRRLRSIAEVPVDIWLQIPQAHKTSTRDAMAIVAAFRQDASAVEAAAQGISPADTHRSAIKKMIQAASPEDSPTSPDARNPLTRKGKRVRLDLSFPDLAGAKAAEKLLLELLREHRLMADPSVTE